MRELTSQARLLDPDLSPDGRTLASVRNAAGRRDLILIRLDQSSGEPSSVTATGIDTLVSEAETQFNAPRWSPDGRSIVVERHRPGAFSEIVVVDVATRNLRVIASEEHARIVTPTWRPDGLVVVAAYAPEGAPFNLYEFPLDTQLAPRQLTRTTGGATWPDVAPDGQSIVFVGYTTDGFDLFLIPYTAGSASVGSGFSRIGSAPVGSAPVGSGFTGLNRVNLSSNRRPCTAHGGH